MNYTSIKNSAFNGGIKLPDFRLYCKAITINTVWFWHKTNINQWNKTETQDKHTYGHLIFDKRG